MDICFLKTSDDKRFGIFREELICYDKQIKSYLPLRLFRGCEFRVR